MLEWARGNEECRIMVRTSLSLSSFVAVVLVCLGSLVEPAVAQSYPSQSIKIMVATPPGGIADLVGRTFAQKLSEGGKIAVVENRTGAGGALAAEASAKAAPDGYTLFVSMHQTNAILPHLVSKLSYDPLKDFTPILHATESANILVIHPSVPAKTVKELVAYAKANPGKLTYASQGNGSSGHVVGEQFKQLAGINITHVPYRGAAPASQDLVAGHVSMMFDIVPLARTQIAAGTVRALAVASPRRLQAVPDGPTMAEAGFPQIEGGPWFGLVAPAGTPRAIVDWLNAEGRKAFSAPDVRDRFLAQGIILPLGTPEQYGSFIEAEYKRWGEIIRSVNIRLE
jgi:tripartite-type tricarboxylate transporter receptor subunit TctC